MTVTYTVYATFKKNLKGFRENADVNTWVCGVYTAADVSVCMRGLSAVFGECYRRRLQSTQLAC